MRILVTGASIVYALPVVRALGRLGHELTVADSRPRASGFYSRYTRARWIHPAPSEGPERFADALCAFLRAHPHDRVLPLFEETIPLAYAQERDPSLVRAPLGRYADLLRFHDKAAAYRFARSVSVPVPDTIEFNQIAPPDFPYPAVVKVPQSSCGRGVLRARTASEARTVAARLSRDHALPGDVPLLLQRELQAESVSVFACAWHGKPKGLLVYKNLCLYPRRGGSGVVRVSVRHPEVERHAATLLRASRWHGPIGFDFLVEHGTGRAFFIDGNPRLTLGAPLAAQCGFDAAAMMASEREPDDAGVVAAGRSSVTEPMLLSWLGECLAAGPSGWREALRMAGPLWRARSELVDAGDLRSLLAGPAALIDLLRASTADVPSGLQMIRHAQYCDYGRRALEAPARAAGD